MKVNYSLQQPPNWKELQEHFTVDWERTVVTYGNIIYSKYPLTPDVNIHELIHVKQQLKYGVKEWWNRYIIGPQFRINQEAQAYKAQYNFVKRKINKPELFLLKLAKDLSGGMYGNVIEFEKALKLIKG